MRQIPPFKLVPEPLDDDAGGLPPFQWASPEVGTRHQLGGSPTLLQEAERPKCSSCGRAMTFYGQLDSINDEFVLADCGLVYVFVCFDDFSVQAFVQSG